MSAIEKPGMVLPGQVIELLDTRGNFFQQTTTDLNGQYQFNTLALGPYWVHPVNSRNQSTTPARVLLAPNAIIGTADFAKRGVMATLKIQNAVDDTFVLVTTFSYTGAVPPTIGPGSGRAYPEAWSQTVDTRFNLPQTMSIPGGFTYWLKCWVPQVVGKRLAYVPGLSLQVASGAIVAPLDKLTEVCP